MPENKLVWLFPGLFTQILQSCISGIPIEAADS